ncbi:unnamed protein product [Staurois parvus]|uniref:Uncharacterized protein n=1 Tax=Staurois parvus TaxID=386267 RepID=A0ABN9EIE7_9NEOB|nr:unnamed protein product [Staurois parvus]
MQGPRGRETDIVNAGSGLRADRYVNAGSGESGYSEMQGSGETDIVNAGSGETEL